MTVANNAAQLQVLIAKYVAEHSVQVTHATGFYVSPTTTFTWGANEADETQLTCFVSMLAENGAVIQKAHNVMASVVITRAGNDYLAFCTLITELTAHFSHELIHVNAVHKAQSFKSECDEWLNPLGFTLHTSNNGTDYRSLDYTSQSARVHVRCLDDAGKKSTELQGFANAFFLRIESGKLQFKHPRIADYIDAIDDLVQESAHTHERLYHRRRLKAFALENK